MKTEIKPIYGRILIKQIREEKTKSGIILAPEAQAKTNVALVEAVASDCRYVKEGDTVLIDKFAGQVIEDTGDAVWTIVKEQDVLAIE